MTGNFKITPAYLKKLGACRDGQREFQKAFPNGGEYQEVLDCCTKEGRIDFGLWLLAHVGTTEDVRVYEDAVNSPGEYIMFAGSVEFKAGANVRFLAAGLGIEVGGGIEAGLGIEAGGEIKSVLGYGIYAGVSVPVKDWYRFAVVSAKAKPEYLLSGHWKPLEGTDAQTT